MPLKPGAEADYIASRKNMPTELGHEALTSLAPRVKAQAFFSARVAEAHILDRMREVSDAYSRGEVSLADARSALKTFLRSEGKDTGGSGMANLASTARLNLVLRQNRAMAAAAGRWAAMNDPAVLKRFPYVIYHAKKDSYARNSHTVLDGKIFRKDDPFLTTHTPPWEFNCRCWLENCDEKTAGGKAEPPTPPDKVKVESESGFEFNPANAFGEFNLESIKAPDLRESAAKTMAEKFGVMESEKPDVYQMLSASKTSARPEKLNYIRTPEHAAMRRTQLEKAYEKRVAVWEAQMRQVGLKTEAIDEVKRFYTIDAAKQGKPPKIEAAPDVKGAYVTKDGESLVIGQASIKDVKKALKNLPHTIKRGMQYRAAKAKRVEAEAKLIGAKAIRGIHTASGDAKKTNPHFDENDKAYSHNCQRCITTYEARRRGIDVEVMPRGLNPDGSLADEAIAKTQGWSMVYQNAKPHKCSGSNGNIARNNIVREIAKMPDGARCAVQVVYENGAGHVFIAERHRGKIVYIDPQEPSRTWQELLSDLRGDNVFVMRLDNLKFNDKVTICCKPRGK